MALRLLATGDIHIGRRPSRVIEPGLAERASAARMWERIVDRAIDLQVDAVLLSGDIVDHDSRFFEATGPLERGILALAEQQIPTYAVAGNHDWDVFPRILNQLDTPLFHFLGRGGTWEEALLERGGEPILRIVGWSFPDRYYQQSPLNDFPVLSDLQVPTVGLLHADLDVLDSSYAPVSLADLQSQRLGLWVLGHVHKPQHWKSETGADVLYPGSPQALDPGETGPHGPWLIELDGSHRVACRHLPMSVVRYEEREVDLNGAKNEQEFETQVNEAVLQSIEDIEGDDTPPEQILLRLRLTGATPLCGRIDELSYQLNELERTVSGIQARIEKHVNLTRPAVDLEQLSRRSDPAGTLARTLLALESGTAADGVDDLLESADERLKEVFHSPTYASLRDGSPDREAVRGQLLQQGRRLLETLRAQLPEPAEEHA